jgi:GNAT superfamily N-acetyltransferase
MVSESETLDPAFENHLAFIAGHRGELSRDESGIRVRSRLAGFTSWTPAGRDSRVPDDCPAVRLPPGASADWPEKLGSLGCGPGETLVYMELADPHAPIGRVTAVEARVARGRDEALDFADVQSAGFVTGDPAIDALWKDAFAEAALANIGDPRQLFYLGMLDGRAVGCTLAVRTGQTTGIYAVATRPAFRGQGVSAALLDRARRDALAEGHARIILQAMAGSYAEGYYARLGFREMYRLTVWRR